MSLGELHNVLLMNLACDLVKAPNRFVNVRVWQKLHQTCCIFLKKQIEITVMKIISNYIAFDVSVLTAFGHQQ